MYILLHGSDLILACVLMWVTVDVARDLYASSNSVYLQKFK